MQRARSTQIGSELGVTLSPPAAPDTAPTWRSHSPLLASLQVTATVPFQIMSALIFNYTVYGMAGLRRGVIPVLQNGMIASFLYLIAVQVRGGVVSVGRALGLLPSWVIWCRTARWRTLPDLCGCIAWADNRP